MTERMEFLRSAVSAALALLLIARPNFAPAAGPALGMVVTTGAFRLNHATVRSNATLFEGAIVETGSAPARMDLSGGGELELELESTGRLLGGHLVLERGAIQIGRSASSAKSVTGINPWLAVEARTLTIEPASNSAAGRIVLIGVGRVEVAALSGSLRILNSRGALVATVSAGNALALEPRPAPGPARITGRLVRSGHHYLLTDETTKVTVELASSASTESDLIRLLEQRVEVMGSAPAAAILTTGAAQLVEVSQVTPAPPLSGDTPAGTPTGSGGAGGTAPAGAGGAGGGARGGAAAHTAVSVTMVAVIGGVAAAAVVGGLAASGKLGGSAATPVSR